jgi:tRNA modification GTPase
MTNQKLDLQFEDTIVSLSTPVGISAIAVIRITGNRSLEFLKILAKKELNPEPRKSLFIDLPNLDEVVAVWFKGPFSYTGEDMLEISCHGSPVIIEKIKKSLLDAGARNALAGEFSWRAVVNGKIDLDKAEFINGRIHAGSETELNLLESSPGMEELFKDLLEKTNEAIAGLESELELQEGEGVGPLDVLEKTLSYLSAQSRLTEKNQSLPGVLLYGPPNCGKSTLFNAIIGYDRALVSEQPGTTRDYIESEFYTGDLGFRLIDSAGVRDSSDLLEEAGVTNTKELFQTSAVVINFGNEKFPHENKIIDVVGKADLHSDHKEGLLGVSGTTREGIGELLNQINEKITLFRESSGWKIWISSRGRAILEELTHELDAAMGEALPELIAVHLNSFRENLRLNIDQPPDDLYERIFSNFCIGK